VPGNDCEGKCSYCFLPTIFVSIKKNTKYTVYAGEGNIAKRFTNQIKEDDMDKTEHERGK
jgi:DNA repair photolyase